MKIVVTGSLGNISLPLTRKLVSNGHDTIVISSSKDRRPAIEAVGARAAIGSVTDRDFLTDCFNDADAVYLMVPPPRDYRDPSFDMMKYSAQVRDNYFFAANNSKIKHLVNLSSWGAHRKDGIGGIAASYHMEQSLNHLPVEVSITHVRPTSFYTNLLSFIPMIKATKQIALNYGGADTVSVVAAEDIADAVADELVRTSKDRSVRYVASDEMTCNEIAGIIGEQIGIPGLQWILIPDQQAKENLLAAGLSEAMAMNVAEIQGAIHKGLLAEDYQNNKPEFGTVKTRDFAKHFASVYNSK